MKQILILMICTIYIYSNTLAQCNSTKKVDDFDSTVTIQTNDFTIFNPVLNFVVGKKSWSLKASFYRQKNTYGIYIEHASEGMTSAIQYIYLKLSDGTIIKKTEPLELKEHNGLGSTTYKGTAFIFTKDELTKVSTTEIEKLKLEFEYFPDFQVVERSPNTNQKKNFKKYATCILEEK
jgi:hypothetical protein